MKRHFIKRLTALILSVALLFTATCAFADSEDEGFTLRSGIKFGDTLDDIVAKETTLTRSEENDDTFVGTIAGYDDAECSFDFDDDGKMISMTYKFDDSFTTRDSGDSMYETLYDSLKRKYDDPIGNSGGSCELIIGPALSSMALWVYWLGTLDGYKADYIDYDEWVVDAGDYNVKIDLAYYYLRDSDYEYEYYLELSYLKFTDEEYDEAINEKQAEQEAVDNDL